MLSNKQATIIQDIVDVATESNFPAFAAGIQARGYTPEEIEQAAAALAKMAGTSNVLSADDF